MVPCERGYVELYLDERRSCHFAMVIYSAVVDIANSLGLVVLGETARATRKDWSVNFRRLGPVKVAIEKLLRA